MLGWSEFANNGVGGVSKNPGGFNKETRDGEKQTGEKTLWH